MPSAPSSLYLRLSLPLLMARLCLGVLTTIFTGFITGAGAAELPKPHTLHVVVDAPQPENRQTGPIPKPHTLHAVVEAPANENEVLPIPKPHTLHAVVEAPRPESRQAAPIPKPHTLHATVDIPVDKKAAASLDGRWNIRWQKDEKSNGPLEISSGAGRVHGKYNAEDNGRLFLLDHGDRLDGYWVENDSDRKCSTSRDGSHHWGKVVLKSAGDRNKFTGSWGYCGETGPYFLSISRKQ